MSGIKNYGLSGIGKDVEFGKKGNRLKSENDRIEVRDFNDSSFVPVSAADPIEDNDLVTKSYLESNMVGNTLELPADGDIQDGAITTWQIGETTYSTAIDELNGLLGLLVPTAPPQLSTFTFAPTGGSNQLLADGADDNTGGNIPSAGSQVYTRFASTLTSTQPNGGTGATGGDSEGANGNLFMNGSDGILSAIVNGSTNGQIALDENDNSGNDGALQLLSNPAYPADTPGFYTALRARLNLSGVQVGYNEASIEHSDTGSTNTIGWVYDDVANAPTISSTSYSLNSSSGKFSSGIQHLTDGDTINIEGTVSNLVGQTYITGTVLRYNTSPAVGLNNMNATDLGTGLSFPLSANLAPQTITGKTIEISSTARFVSSSVNVRAWNSNGSTGTQTVSGDPLLVYTNNLEGGNKPHEVRITGSSENAYRYYLGSGFTGDSPSGTLPAPTSTNWDEEQLLNASGYEHEAVIVAGQLKQDTTDYTSNHIPVTSGADYSSKDSSQYATFIFNQSTLSSISVNITGNYAGLWVALPGVSDDSGISPNALGGNWWDAFALYNGSGVPGRSGDSNAGCATGAPASGSSGTVNMTFGTQSSTNSTNNTVILRIKLNAGQSISAISIGNTP